MIREQGAEESYLGSMEHRVCHKIDLRSTKNYFREHQENNSGSQEKRDKFQMEPGAGDPLTGSHISVQSILLLFFKICRYILDFN